MVRTKNIFISQYDLKNNDSIKVYHTMKIPTRQSIKQTNNKTKEPKPKEKPNLPQKDKHYS